MTWYDSNFKYRQRVAVYATGGSGVPATVDAEFLVPSDWDHFWTNIRSDMFDAVATSSKGQVLTFARKAGANYSTRTLSIQVDALAIDSDDAINMIYLYYGHSGASDASSGVSISSAKTGVISLQRPHAYVVPAVGRNNAADTPLTSFNKAAAEVVDVFFMLGGMLANRLDSYNERLDQEDIKFVNVFSYDSSGSHDDARMTELATEMGAGFVRARYKAGSSGSDYAIAIQIHTTENQILQSRAILRVKDLLPS